LGFLGFNLKKSLPDTILRYIVEQERLIYKLKKMREEKIAVGSKKNGIKMGKSDEFNNRDSVQDFSLGLYKLLVFRRLITVASKKI